MDLTLIVFGIIFLIGIIIAYFVGHNTGSFRRDNYWRTEIPIHRRQAIAQSRAVLSGNFSEQLAPFLPNFPYSPTECKFLGKPIDFLVFEGGDEGGVRAVKFVEVKSGNSKLNKKEKSLKDAIDKKNVSWETYKIPEKLTKKEVEDEN